MAQMHGCPCSSLPFIFVPVTQINPKTTKANKRNLCEVGNENKLTLLVNTTNVHTHDSK
jgi:hypothetical protein